MYVLWRSNKSYLRIIVDTIIQIGIVRHLNIDYTALEANWHIDIHMQNFNISLFPCRYETL